MAAAGLPVARLHVGERVPAHYAAGQATGACHVSLLQHKMSRSMLLQACSSRLYAPADRLLLYPCRGGAHAITAEWQLTPAS